MCCFSWSLIVPMNSNLNICRQKRNTATYKLHTNYTIISHVNSIARARRMDTSKRNREDRKPRGSDVMHTALRQPLRQRSSANSTQFSFHQHRFLPISSRSKGWKNRGDFWKPVSPPNDSTTKTEILPPRRTDSPLPPVIPEEPLPPQFLSPYESSHVYDCVR